MRLSVKKRYILLTLLVGGFIASKSEMCTFRRSDSRTLAYFEKRGLPAPTIQTFEVDGQAVHYTHMGDTSKPLVVLVHGSPGSSSAYLSYLADSALLSIAQIVAVDRPGFGFSGFGRAEGSLTRQAAVLQPILDRYPGKPAILVGHSYGGPVIVKAAMDFPEKVGGIIIVAGSLDPALEPDPWWQPVVSSPPMRWLLPASMVVSNDEIIPLRAELEAIQDDWTRVVCPVTVIQGTKDNLVPAGNADYIKAMLPHNQALDIQMIEGGSHFILWSMQDYIVGQINQMRVRLLELDVK